MGDRASQLLARALCADESPSPPLTFDWVSRDLGTPTFDLEDGEALNARLMRNCILPVGIYILSPSEYVD